MTKVLNSEQAEQIIPRAERKRAARQSKLEERERDALEELQKLGFRVTVHDLPREIEADPLMGIAAGVRPGQCYAVMYSVDGKRKHAARSRSSSEYFLGLAIAGASPSARTAPGIGASNFSRVLQGAEEAAQGERRASARERDLEGRVRLFRAGARPEPATVTRYVEEWRDAFGVEPICEALGVPVSTH